MVKKCNHCKEVRDIEFFANNKRNEDGLNATCRKCTTRQSYDLTLRTHYGITLYDFAIKLQNQDFKCAICKKDITKDLNGHDINQDHDHLTRQNRGILCHNCNVALGLLNDDIDRLQIAIDYLNSYNLSTSARQPNLVEDLF